MGALVLWWFKRFGILKDVHWIIGSFLSFVLARMSQIHLRQGYAATSCHGCIVCLKNRACGCFRRGQPPSVEKASADDDLCVSAFISGYI